MKPRFLLLALLAAAASLAIGGIALAQSKKSSPLPDKEGFIPYSANDNPVGWNMPYQFVQDPTDPTYKIAFKAMAPTYKGKLNYFPDPLLGIVEQNLNNDKLPEIISFPTEEYEEEGKFCNLKGLCPHYVIQIGEKQANVIGVLFGYKVNLGDRVVNGYRTLKAYTLPEKNPDYFEEYAYNPSAKVYQPVKP